MKKNNDSIQFENRGELAELLRVVGEYVKQNPKEKNNKILQRFYNLIDIMKWNGKHHAARIRSGGFSCVLVGVLTPKKDFYKMQNF